MIEAILIGATVVFVMKLILGSVIGSAATSLAIIIGILVGASCYFALFEDRSYRKALDRKYNK